MNVSILNKVCVALAVMAAGAAYTATELSGAEAPDFVLKSVSGENLRLSEYRGQVVMLSFWASWCGDCRAQLEELDDFYSLYQSAGFEVLAISLDSNPRQVNDTAERMKVGYPVLHDVGGAVGRLYEVDSMPLVVMVDRGGVVREVFEGYRRGGTEPYLESIRALLRE